MKVAQILVKRREDWQALEKLCTLLENRVTAKLLASDVTRMATLYRSACADLALADAYELPPDTVQYLHKLVGRAHNQLHRSKRFEFARWKKTLLQDVPRYIFHDRCVRVAAFLFWGVFILSAFLAASTTAWPEYAETLLGPDQIDLLEKSFKDPIGTNSSGDIFKPSFYIRHNTTIGLQCFVGGLLVIPGLYITVFNAAVLGGSFGYMARPDVAASPNFYHFVTAHAPFELTAVVLAAGAGLRLGMAVLRTEGFTRIASLTKKANEAVPIMGASGIMFFLAAVIEGCISPSNLPYFPKAMVAIISSAALIFYFVFLGYPSEEDDAT